MSLAYHRRLFMRESLLSRSARWPILAAVWVILLSIDVILFLMGWSWSSLRNSSRLDW